VTEPTTPTRSFSGRTPWARSLPAPLRAFLQTESGTLLRAVRRRRTWNAERDGRGVATEFTPWCAAASSAP
jgi:hypothetical protein